MVAETDKRALADNCRLALYRFFFAFPPKKKKVIGMFDIFVCLDPLVKQGLTFDWADDQWRIYDIETIREIRKYSFWKEGIGGLDYELPFHDCDDFAELCKALWSMFWDTNCLGRCKGNIIYNEQITPHAFDIVIAINEKDEVKAYLFDTQFNTEPVELTDNLPSFNLTSWRINSVRL